MRKKPNKNHGGKEFFNEFHFVGQVKKTVKGVGDNAEVKPIFELTQTKTNKPRRVLQFDILTHKHNRLKVDMGGMEFPIVTLWSSTESKSAKIPWKDRLDKSKYPNTTYTIIGGTEWDNCATWGGLLSEGAWVEVKGVYEFDSYINPEGKVYLIVKRRPTSITFIKESEKISVHIAYATQRLEIAAPEEKIAIQKELDQWREEAKEHAIKLANGESDINEVTCNKQKIDYVCDFDSPDFQEVNHFVMELGIRSTYQDDETKNTRVNGVFLGWGKERSTPKNVELDVYYKPPVGNETPMADGFASLSRLDFVEVRGTDNNRLEFAEVEEEADDDFDPFANVLEQEAKTNIAISGRRKGLEILAPIGKPKKDFLTEEEISDDLPDFCGEGNPFPDLDSEEDPF